MPFEDTNHDVFLGEKSFATWHEALDRYETLPVHKNSSRTWRRAQRSVAQMREYLTALRKVWFSQCVQHFPASTEMFSCIARSDSCSRSRRTSVRNQPSPKDSGGIDESIDLSRDR
jgi:hypothetical protein